MILSNWAILAILTAVVSENLMTACANHRKKLEDEQQKKNRLALTKRFGIEEPPRYVYIGVYRLLAS